MQAIYGEVAERFKAAVLKTVEGRPSGGSNPSLSASLLDLSGRYTYIIQFKLLLYTIVL